MSTRRELFLGHRSRILVTVLGALGGLAAGVGGCGSDGDLKCEVMTGADAPDFVKRIGCPGDFGLLASEPLDATIPGARSVKVVLDQFDQDNLYFQNSQKFRIHYDFASKYLSGPKLPLVPPLSQFNRTEYYAADRRFILGAVTYYEGPDIWALEIAPYDTASPDMIAKLFAAVRKSGFFSSSLAFHPTSESVGVQAAKLPTSIPVKTTTDIFAETEYQPLNLGCSIGKLRFMKAAELEKQYVAFREIVVLDRVPNDISVTAGIITEEFQTPLSHINVLAQNRKTPNMGLRGATTNSKLSPVAGKWVELCVKALEWSVREVSQTEADAWWEEHKPKGVSIPALDLDTKGLPNIEDITPEGAEPLGAVLQKAVRAFGAKATNYSILVKTPGVPIRKGFAIPVYYYVQFMRENGFFDRVDALLADEAFKNDPSVRDAKLAELRNAIKVAPVNAEFQALLKAKLDANYPGVTMRFRTSTNAEDLEGFPCAGCYDSHTGDPARWDDDLLVAIKKTWSGVWFFRTFEERSYHSIDHKAVGMALLVHHNFPEEEANGVALTANPFDASGLEPAFYVNVQWGGGAEVVHPPPGITSDEFLYFTSGPVVSYLAHSNLVPVGQNVLNMTQITELATALDAIHRRFSPAFGPEAGNNGWYAMDVEFKYDDEDAPGQPPTLRVKQARPHPGRGQ